MQEEHLQVSMVQAGLIQLLAHLLMALLVQLVAAMERLIHQVAQMVALEVLAVAVKWMVLAVLLRQAKATLVALVFTVLLCKAVVVEAQEVLVQMPH